MRVQKSIIVIDDEPDIAELISIHLTKAGYKVKSFADGEKFFQALQYSALPDLILLDLMLPGQDGFDICRQLRKQKETAQIPVIMLTAKDDEVDKILGLELGADDYVTKPFSVKELAARVKAVLRRQHMEEKPLLLQFGRLAIDPEKYEVTIAGKALQLTTTEYKILYTMVLRPGIVFSRDKLLDILWGTEKIVIDRTIDVHVKHLREKLGVCGEMIKNVRGIGYKFSQEA